MNAVDANGNETPSGNVPGAPGTGAKIVDYEELLRRLPQNTIDGLTVPLTDEQRNGPAPSETPRGAIPKVVPPRPTTPPSSTEPEFPRGKPINTTPAPQRDVNRSAWRVTETPVIRTRYVSHRQAEPTTPANPIAGKATAGDEPPPILISIGPAGLIVTCDDPQALKDFVDLAKTFASRQTGNQREYTVYYLKFAKAQSTAEMLEQLFAAGGSSSSGGGGGGLVSSLAGAAFGDMGGGLMGNLLGMGGGGGDSAPKLAASGSISIIPEVRLNALIVQANETDLDTIEQILKVLDQEQSPEDVTLINKPRLIAVHYTPAEEIAAVVKSVYADRMAGGAGGGGGGQRQPSPQEFIQALRGGGGRNDQRRRQAEEAPKMTIGVDNRTNSLVVTATEALFQEVAELVQDLDKETIASNETMEIVTLKNSSPAAVQQALTQIVGPEYLKNSTPANISPQTSGMTAGINPLRSNRTSPTNNPPQQQFQGGGGFDPAMFQAIQRGMGGQGGGGRGQGGGGRGGMGGGGMGGGGMGGGGRGQGGGGGRGGR
ncbi:MAG: secretin N-terminal domain-containing protein [Pirellulales bacterium]